MARNANQGNPFGIVFECALSSFLWIVLMIIFALLQLWVLIWLAYLRGEAGTVLEKSLRDGLLLFFITAMVTSIAIDYWLDKDVKKIIRNKSVVLSGVIWFLAPTITYFFIIPSYTTFVLDPEKIDADVFARIQVLGMVFTTIYAFIIKLLLRLPSAVLRR